MPKRSFTRSGLAPGPRAPRHSKFQRQAGWQPGGGRPLFRQTRGRRAGYLRKSGYYGRYNGTPGSELKFHHADLGLNPIAQAGDIVTSLNLIPQGVEEDERIGRKCTIKQINLRWTLTLPEAIVQTTPLAGDVVRVMCILDKQANGSAATVGSVLQQVNYHGWNNMANSSRYKTLMDRSYVLDYKTLASHTAARVDMSEVLIEDSFYKKCHYPLEFNGTTGAIAEIRSNNLFMLYIARTGVVQIAGSCRVRFEG